MLYKLGIVFDDEKQSRTPFRVSWSLIDLVNNHHAFSLIHLYLYRYRKAPHLLLLIRPPFSKLQRSESPPTLLSGCCGLSLAAHESLPSRFHFASTCTSSTARPSEPRLRVHHSALQTVPLGATPHSQPSIDPRWTLVPRKSDLLSSRPPISRLVHRPLSVRKHIPSIGPGDSTCDRFRICRPLNSLRQFPISFPRDPARLRISRYIATPGIHPPTLSNPLFTSTTDKVERGSGELLRATWTTTTAHISTWVSTTLGCRPTIVPIPPPRRPSLNPSSQVKPAAPRLASNTTSKPMRNPVNIINRTSMPPITPQVPKLLWLPSSAF